MKRNGNKALMIIGMALLAILLTGCPGINDWSYNDLPNQYIIMKINSGDIQVGKLDEQGYEKRIIDRYVISFCYNSQYIGIQRISVDLPYHDVKTFEDLDQSKVAYYLIDSETDTVWGPLTIDEYNRELETNRIFDMCEWISTASRPSGAK